MLENLDKINWQQIFDKADHTYNFLLDFDIDEPSYSIIPRLLREMAEGNYDFLLFESIFGEMPHDLDGKLFELVLPFLWEIFLEAEEPANMNAFDMIEEGIGRFYTMECDGIELTMGENGIDRVPKKLLGNKPDAAFAKLKSLLEQDNESAKIKAINVLSFVPDYPGQTVVLFQNLLGKAEPMMDEILLSALGRLLYRQKLPITADFQKYLDDESHRNTQGIAAFWMLRIDAEKASKKAAQLLLEVANDYEWLNEIYDKDSSHWYYSDYLVTEDNFPPDFMNKVRQLAA